MFLKWKEIELQNNNIRKPRMLTSYLLFSTQKDFIEPGFGPPIVEIRTEGDDPFISRNTTLIEAVVGEKFKELGETTDRIRATVGMPRSTYCRMSWRDWIPRGNRFW